MGGIFEKAVNPLGAIAPGLSPSKIAAEKLNMPFLDPSQLGKSAPPPRVIKRTRPGALQSPSTTTVADNTPSPSSQLLRSG